jgi:hypothetical protein
VEHVKEVAPKINPLTKGLEAVTQRVLNVENTLEPVLTKVDEEIGKLNVRSTTIQDVIDREVSNLKNVAQTTQDVITQELSSQNIKHDSLIQHA